MKIYINCFKNFREFRNILKNFSYLGEIPEIIFCPFLGILHISLVKTQRGLQILWDLVNCMVIYFDFCIQTDKQRKKSRIAR